MNRFHPHPGNSANRVPPPALLALLLTIVASFGSLAAEAPGKDDSSHSQGVEHWNGALILDYLTIPAPSNLTEVPVDSNLYRFFRIDANNYIGYYNVGFDFPEPKALAAAFEREPHQFLALKDIHIEKSPGSPQENGSFVFRGTGKKSDGSSVEWIAAAVMNRRFNGSRDKASPTAGLLFVFGPSLGSRADRFLDALKHKSVHQTDPRKRTRFYVPAGDFSIEAPTDFAPLADPSGLRLAAPNGAYLLLAHQKSEGAVLQKDLEKWKAAIEKGFYSYLFAKGYQKMEGSRRLESGDRQVIRLDASVQLPAPYSYSSNASFFLFSTFKGVGIIIVVGPATDPETLDEMLRSIRVERHQPPLDIQY